MSHRSARLAWGLSGLLVLLTAGGCGKGHEDRFNQAAKESGVETAGVAPLAGTVTIDGNPPALEGARAVFVVLNDVSKPNEPLEQRLSAQCDEHGKFEFSSFSRGDGVPPGTYIITIAMLKVGGRGYVGPDQLKNLYNNPEVNAQNPEFKIVHKPPGKKDYAVDLTVAGKEPAQPGKYSVLFMN
jgi:hypothetical protein